MREGRIARSRIDFGGQFEAGEDLKAPLRIPSLADCASVCRISGIARTLHETVAQSMAALKMTLSKVHKRLREDGSTG